MKSGLFAKLMSSRARLGEAPIHYSYQKKSCFIRIRNSGGKESGSLFKSFERKATLSNTREQNLDTFDSFVSKILVFLRTLEVLNGLRRSGMPVGTISTNFYGNWS